MATILLVLSLRQAVVKSLRQYSASSENLSKSIVHGTQLTARRVFHTYAAEVKAKSIWLQPVKDWTLVHILFVLVVQVDDYNDY